MRRIYENGVQNLQVTCTEFASFLAQNSDNPTQNHLTGKNMLLLLKMHWLHSTMSQERYMDTAHLVDEVVKC